MAPDSNHLETIFHEAAALESPAERTAFLNKACAHDSDLRGKIERLLVSHDAAGSFLNLPDLDESPESAMSLREGPGSVIGRYKLLQQVGEGGFGVVFMAQQETPVRRKVALKIIKLGMDTKQVVARFEAERQALAMMDHPNIAKVLDAGSTDTGRPYFVMELVKGVSITSYCQQAKLTTKARLDLFITVCSAVQHAHQKGIIHRDLKPSNVLVTMLDGKPMPMVIDFGIAKATQGRLTEKTLFTEFKQFVGTPTYMSPEQAQLTSMDVDTRSDIYSLGVLLYELLTGTTPFDAKELLSLAYDEMKRVIREVEPPKPSTRLSTLGTIATSAAGEQQSGEARDLSRMLRGDLDSIVMKCLEKDRARRYDSAGNLADDIQRHLNGEPVAASPPSATYRLKKFVRKHRRPLEFASVVILLLVSATIVSTREALWATRAESLARSDRDKAVRAGAAAEAARQDEAAAKEEALRQKDVAQKALSHTETESYFASIYAADAALNFNSLGSAELFLAGAPERLRNWEWHYLNAVSNPQTLSLLHPDLVLGAVFSPDGSQIVTFCYDKSVHFWNAQTSRELAVVRGKGPIAYPQAASPDGRRIVAACADFTMRIWDDQGNELAIASGHTAGVSNTFFSPDGKWFVTSSKDMTARVWDTETGRERFTLSGHAQRVSSSAISRDGKLIATVSGDGTARIWDAETGRLSTTIDCNHGPLSVAAFSPDSQRIVLAGWDSSAHVFNVADGHELASLPGHNSIMNSVKFSPDGKWILTANSLLVRVFDASNGQLLVTLRGHNDRVNDAIFSPDGTHILSASYDHTARVWEIDKPSAVRVFGAEKDQARAPCFNSDGSELMTLHSDGTARIWQSATGKLLATLGGEGKDVLAALFSHTGTEVIAACSDKAVHIWNTASSGNGRALTGHEAEVIAVDQTMDGRLIASGSNDGTVRLWESASGRLLATLGEHLSNVSQLHFSPDGTKLLCLSQPELIYLWDTVSHQPLATIHHDSPPPYDNMIHFVTFSPDSRRILTASEDFHARLWDAATGKPISQFSGDRGPARYASFNPGASRIVTALQDGTARVWDVANVRELMTLKGHETGVKSAVYSPDGTRILTAAQDKTACLWDAATGRQILILRGHTGQLLNAQFSPDGTFIATVALDGTVRLWDSITPEERARKLMNP